MRRLAIYLAIGSLVVPFAWCDLANRAYYREASAHHLLVCGLPALSNFILASFICVVTSTVAFVIGFVAYHRLPRPRSVLRVLELAALALPSLVIGGLAVSLLITL
jgi:hypothetical protein